MTSGTGDDRLLRPAPTVAPLRALLVASVLAPALLFGIGAWYDHHRLHHEAEQRATHSVAVLREHALKTFETAELVLDLAERQLRGQDWRAIGDSRDLWQGLKDLEDKIVQVGAIFVVDRDGRNPLTTRVFPAPEVDFSDRDYYLAQRDRDVGLFISKSYVGKISKGPIFNLSIRRSHPGGEFDGVVGLSFFVDYFETFYARAAPHDDGYAISLVRADGEILVRQPALPTTAALTASREFRQGIQQANTGTYWTTGQLDGVRRLVAYSKVGNLPVYATFGVDERTILAIWHRHLLLWGLAALVVALGLVTTSRIAMRRSGEAVGAVQRWQTAVAELQAEIVRREQAEAAALRTQRLEAVGQLTAGLAHDFNNLLTAAQGNLELLKLETPSREVETLADRAMSALQKGSTLTAQLLAFARDQKLTLAPVAINDMITALRDLLERSAGPAVSLSFRLADDAGAALVDRAQIEVALINLVVNARDAMSLGGRIQLSTRTVTADAELPADLEPDAYVVIDVTDNGPGMAAEVLAHAFEPFFTTKPVGRGSGLGLAQVYGIARQSGGTARIDSAAGRGTTVSIFLRQTPREPVADSVVAHKPRATAPSRILLVDDDVSVRPVIAQMLRSMGHAVEEFEDGHAALARLAVAPFDVLVCDYAMPGLSGADIAARAVDTRPDLAILLITGFPAQPSAFAWPVLRKPFRRVELAEALARVNGAAPGLRLVSDQS